MNNDRSDSHTPLEQPMPVLEAHQSLTIGLPGCQDTGERRFPLTPEGVRILTERGYRVKMEQGAAKTIHYDDARYERGGAIIGTRTEALSSDIVISLAPLSAADICKLRRGAMLLTLLQPERQSAEAIRQLLQRHIIAIALDLVSDSDGNTPFADILSEIDGRTAIAIASSMLADADSGKGILLGGVAGIVPCEVTIIGSGIAACAAARAASGAGATVRMFDSDVYSLRRAARELGPWAITSAMHPNVLDRALRSADVVINTISGKTIERIDSDRVQLMKRGVVIFDLTDNAGKMFPSLPVIDSAENRRFRDLSEAPRVCYVNAGSVVPRTAAMAMTNCLTTLLTDLSDCDGTNNAIKLLPGLQRATYTFLGKAVNRRIAEAAGCRAVDISIFISMS